MTAEEKALLGTMSDEDLARKLGRSVFTIADWRRRLKIPVFAAKRRPWTAEELKMLGKHPDTKLARRLNRDVAHHERKLAVLRPLPSNYFSV